MFYLVSTVETTFYDTNLLYYIIMILLFSNQKGGVGKSTLAALYANHLANGDENAGIMPRKVQFIEADMQRSLSSQREEDVAAGMGFR